MKNTYLSLILGIFWANMALGQDTPKDTTYWEKAFSFGVNFNQGSFSSNWKAGGANSIAFGAVLTAKANYLKDKWSWNNDLEMLYGLVWTDGVGQRKNADRIFLNSVAAYKIAPKWNLFMSGNFLSQFAEGLDYATDPLNPVPRLRNARISNTFSPAFLTFAWGLEYKPVKWFSVKMSPFSPRFTFVSDDGIRPDAEGRRFGVENGRSVRTEWLAAQIQADLDAKLAENINLKARYLMFLNYQTFDPDHRLDVLLEMAVNKYIKANFGATVLYDTDQDTSIQWSQLLNVGFLYSIDNKKKK
ncbi:MAG: DUF3078 domain-containing protein [Bernardetiaceae bacterium]|jgi:hypothetical protein|nr:DUF3078 domain-containing protein [Bernardetiaceae bacterium]